MAILEIAGHIIGMMLDKMLEMRRGGLIVAELRAFERQAIASECIGRSRGDELLKNFAAGLLRLGHRS